MREGKRTTAIVLAGGVALASTAYAIGSQSSDGDATARGSDERQRAPLAGPPGGPHGGFGLDSLADELGVDAEELQNALDDFHEQEADDGKQRFASALARALGISTEKVTAALESERAEHEARFARRLAAALDLEPATVREALEKVAGDGGPRGDGGPGGDGGPARFLDELATALGVEGDRLHDALHRIRPAPRGGPGARHGASGLADELGVTEARLRRALRQVWRTERSGWEERRDELARFLADRLDLEVDDVEQALGDLPRPSGGPEPGRHSRGGVSAAHPL